MNDLEIIKWIKDLIVTDKIIKFYQSKYWTELKEEVMKEQHRECQDCKINGKIVDGKKVFIIDAETVHHEKEVKKYPEYALSKYVVISDKKIRQLTCLCNDCHNKRHNRFGYKKKKLLNEEKW